MRIKIIFVIALLATLSIKAQKDSLKSQTLKEVVVKKKLKLLERRADRMIFNVDASIASQGMDAAETLSNVPLIKVDESIGSVSLIGKSSVAVMINGKMLNLTGTSLLNYLKTIRSENIAKIEVITIPPAKYEAQGNSGLINIILKKNPSLGFSGNIGQNYIQRSFSGFSDHATLNYKTEKFAASLKMNYFNSSKKSIENYSIIGEDENHSRSVRKDIWKELTPNISLSYKPNTKTEVGVEYQFANQRSGMDIINSTKNLVKNISEDSYLTNTTHREKLPAQTLSAFYDYKLDSLGKKISITGNFFKNPIETDVHFVTEKQSDKSMQTVKTWSKVGLQVASLQADVELPYAFGSIETGAKFTNFKNDSDLKYYNVINSQQIPDYNRFNIFNYTEDNYAVYGSFSKNFGENWQAKAGLRYEQTLAHSSSPNTQAENRYKYGEWFPSAFINYRNGKNNWSIAYSRRINRPSMSNLNPFRWYETPYSYSSGNPLLAPSFINNIELTYTRNNKLMLSTYFLHLKNGFGQVSFLEKQSQTSTYLNYYDNNNWGASFSYTDSFFKIWESSISGNASYNTSKIYNIEANANSGVYFSYSINNTVILNKDKTLVFFLNYNQSLPYKNANSYFYNFSDLTSGLKITLMERQLQINATVTNIFAQYSKGNLYFKDNKQYFNNYWDGRSFRLSVNYNFGSQKRFNKKTINFEDKDRAN